jgi:hypothetical protein
MSKSTKPVSAPAITLEGKSAKDIRALLDTKQVNAKAVVAFLQAKEAAHGLRAPSAALLAELTGTAPAKADKPAAPAKADKPVVAPAFDAAAFLARLTALEGAVAALVALKTAPAKGRGNARKAS